MKPKCIFFMKKRKIINFFILLFHSSSSIIVRCVQAAGRKFGMDVNHDLEESATIARERGKDKSCIIDNLSDLSRLEFFPIAPCSFDIFRLADKKMAVFVGPLDICIYPYVSSVNQFFSLH